MLACSTLCSAAPVAYLFGEKTQSAANLGWATYHHVHDASDPRDALKTRLIAWLAQFVVLYPAVNVLATYPLNVITFGDALLAAHRRFQANGEVSATPPSRTSVRIAPIGGRRAAAHRRAFNRTSRPSRTSRAASAVHSARSCPGVPSLGGAATGAGADGARVAAERKSGRGGAGPCGPRADGRDAAAAL